MIILDVFVAIVMMLGIGFAVAGFMVGFMWLADRFFAYWFGNKIE